MTFRRRWCINGCKFNTSITFIEENEYAACLIPRESARRCEADVQEAAGNHLREGRPNFSKPTREPAVTREAWEILQRHTTAFRLSGAQYRTQPRGAAAFRLPEYDCGTRVVARDFLVPYGDGIFLFVRDNVPALARCLLDWPRTALTELRSVASRIFRYSPNLTELCSAIYINEQSGLIFIAITHFSSANRTKEGY